jgi:transcription elongation factor Elf1
MGRRRKSRKKVILKPKKTLPKIFTCPHCGAPVVNVKVDKKEGKVLVTCGNCGLEAEFNHIPGLLPVDYFNKFVDLYYQGVIKPKKEVTISLTQLMPRASASLEEQGISEGLGEEGGLTEGGEFEGEYGGEGELMEGGEYTEE